MQCDSENGAQGDEKDACGKNNVPPRSTRLEPLPTIRIRRAEPGAQWLNAAAQGFEPAAIFFGEYALSQQPEPLIDSLQFLFHLSNVTQKGKEIRIAREIDRGSRLSGASYGAARFRSRLLASLQLPPCVAEFFFSIRKAASPFTPCREGHRVERLLKPRRSRSVSGVSKRAFRFAAMAAFCLEFVLALIELFNFSTGHARERFGKGREISHDLTELVAEVPYPDRQAEMAQPPLRNCGCRRVLLELRECRLARGELHLARIGLTDLLLDAADLLLLLPSEV